VRANKLSTTEDAEDTEENPVQIRIEPPVLRALRGGVLFVRKMTPA
jgi:hypothetical protein